MSQENEVLIAVEVPEDYNPHALGVELWHEDDSCTPLNFRVIDSQPGEAVAWMLFHDVYEIGVIEADYEKANRALSYQPSGTRIIPLFTHPPKQVECPLIIKQLADWERENGTIAAACVEEFEAIAQIVKKASLLQSPRQVEQLFEQPQPQSNQPAECERCKVNDKVIFESVQLNARLVEERDAFKNRCDEYLETITNQAQQLTAANEEIARLRKDAGRYKWLRQGDNDEYIIEYLDSGQGYLPREDRLDSVIDEAIAAQSSNGEASVDSEGWHCD